MAVCTDKGQLCAAKGDCEEGEQPILLMENNKDKSYCDVNLTQRALIAVTY